MTRLITRTRAALSAIARLPLKAGASKFARLIEIPNKSRLAIRNAWPSMRVPNRLGGTYSMSNRFRAALTATGLLATAAPAQAQQAYSDPQGSGVLVSAVGWLQGTLLGTVATVAAIIAVAAIGFMMLTGRINWRYGVTVILGCFILFGATSIVAGIHSAATLGQ